MPLFNNWPYVDLSKLNLNWLIKKMKELDLTVEDLKKKLSDLNISDYVYNALKKLLDEGLLQVGPIYDQTNSSAWLEDSTELIGTLELPAGHVLCSMEFLNGYVYAAHHVDDLSMMYISKYSWPDLNRVDTQPIEAEMHGNGLGSDVVNNLIILSNGWNTSLTNSHTIYLINATDLSIEKKIDYSPFGRVSISTFDISPDGSSAAALLTGSNKILEYDINATTKTAHAVRIHDMPEVGDGIRQDGTLTDTFYYQLFSNNSLPEYSNNQIVLYSFRTGYFKTLYLAKDKYDELEGISRIRYGAYIGILIADVNGKLYFADTSNKIIASGLLTKSDNVCAGKPQYMVTNPMQLNTMPGTVDDSVTSDNYDITLTTLFFAPSFNLAHYSLRMLELNQDAWKVHLGWYYAPLCFGDRYFLTGMISMIHGQLLIRYGYYDNLGGIQLQRLYYHSYVDDSYTAWTNTTGPDSSYVDLIKKIIDENHDELQEDIKLYPEIWNTSDYARTGAVWNIDMSF